MVHAGEEVDEKAILLFKEREIKEALVRSPLTCRTRCGYARGVMVEI